MKPILLFICFLFCIQIHAITQSISDLQIVEKELETLEGEVLVLFDVDRTLITPDDAILSPPGDELLDTLLGESKVKNGEGVHKYLFREILLNAPHRIIDERSVEMIKRFQSKGIPVIAFTAAPRGTVGNVESVADWRIDEMKRFGFDFSSAFPNVGTLELAKDPEKDFSPIFKEGILFSSLHCKGTTLKEFLQLIGCKPKHVIFVDDQMKYVSSVESVVEDLGIGYIGFHYTAAEDLPCDLDPELAAFQIRHFLKFKEWKNDEEARKLFRAPSNFVKEH